MLTTIAISYRSIILIFVFNVHVDTCVCVCLFVLRSARLTGQNSEIPRSREDRKSFHLTWPTIRRIRG